MTAERTAFNILTRITQEGAYANLALKEGLSDVRTSDVGRLTALVYTAVENLNYCDFLIDSYSKGRVHTSIRNVLRLGIAELMFMDAPDHAVCNRTAALSREIGKSKLTGFVNAVMRSVARDRQAGTLPALPDDFTARMAILSGYPDFMIREYAARYGETFTEALLLKKAEGISLRAVYPHGADELRKHLDAMGAAFRESSLVPDAVVAESFSGNIAADELFADGRMTVQSESAMLACRCLGLSKGMRVLDACAAPGGKTAYMADLMERTGSISAWDVHPHRVELIRNTLERLRVTNAECSVRDASVPDEGLFGSFDAVLCDVPCSGLGGGSKPDARYRRTESSVEELSSLQLNILRACSRCLKPGGALVYSTCTVSERENERVIERFLNENEGFSLGSLAPYLPETLAERGRDGMLQLFPNVDGTEGFFIARLIRTV
ncbi:MAG: 16S rRNA (cytosine(967)-C(5))-methyltransferase RsmB [Clostridia bacterium]|nr:16S rRNA (cytosine(967)-C(5))-methyltransferase RsmB [Clostridia bacterium]